MVGFADHNEIYDYYDCDESLDLGNGCILNLAVYSLYDDGDAIYDNHSYTGPGDIFNIVIERDDYEHGYYICKYENVF